MKRPKYKLKILELAAMYKTALVADESDLEEKEEVS
jgi:hypothetical protein